VAAAGLAAAGTAVALTVTLSSGPPASHGQARPTFTPSTGPTAAASPSSPAIPAGYHVYTDPGQHFSAAIPDTWTATTENGGLRLCAPGGCPEVIFVQRQVTGGSDPIVDIRSSSAASGHFLPASDYSNYHRLRIGPVAYYAQAAETEFTLHKRSTSADLHGLARVFTVTSGGQEYYVQLTALSATWQKSQPIFGVFFATFRPGRS